MNDMVGEVTARQTGQSAPKGVEATIYSLLDAADQIQERVGEALGRVGLSYPKYEVLEHLRKAREPVSLGSLADGQSCARSNITQLVDKLESEGLVRRLADPGDRRGVLAELTEEGAARATEGKTQLDLVLAEFAASFTAPERVQLGRLLEKLK